ncbi:hypothetical protein MPER_12441 [Moniliophthora perniciosa FA553]|nr:hypothetical protein MPER_12441 [Moniliophthora perniciosa FA553]
MSLNIEPNCFEMRTFGKMGLKTPGITLAPVALRYATLSDTIRHYLTNPQKSDTITKRCKKNFGKNVTWGPNSTVKIRRGEYWLDQQWDMVLVMNLGEDPDDSAEPPLTYIPSPYRYNDTP